MTKRQFLKMILSLGALLPVLGKSWASGVPPGITSTQLPPSEPNAAPASPSGTAVTPVQPATAISDTSAYGAPTPQPAAAAHKARERILIQRSPIAGFQYHAGEQIWPQLKRRQALRLKREADNKHDVQAVAIYWRRHKVGYLPRVENTAVAQLLDRGEHLTVRIVHLEASANPWQRMSVAVWLRV